MQVLVVNIITRKSIKEKMLLLVRVTCNSFKRRTNHVAEISSRFIFNIHLMPLTKNEISITLSCLDRTKIDINFILLTVSVSYIQKLLVASHLPLFLIVYRTKMFHDDSDQFHLLGLEGVILYISAAKRFIIEFLIFKMARFLYNIDEHIYPFGRCKLQLHLHFLSISSGN